MQNAEIKPQDEPLPTPPEQLLEILQSLDIAYKIYNHAPIFTVAEGEHLESEIPGVHCRNLFFADKKKIMYLVVAANSTKLDIKKLAGVIDSDRLSFGSADRLWRHLGIRPGSVCPFTVINDKNHEVNVVLDAAMMQSDLVCYHPLDNAMTIALTPAALMKFFAHTGHQPRTIDLTPATPDPTS